MSRAYDARLKELADRIAYLENCRLPEPEIDQLHAISNPHSLWIERNIDKIRALGDGWAVIHPEHGITFLCLAEDEFERHLDALGSKERLESLPIHTSTYRR